MALVETRIESRKEWVAPELKKIKIGVTTALGPEIANDLYSGAFTS
jgi:hypothetical protein